MAAQRNHPQKPILRTPRMYPFSATPLGRNSRREIDSLPTPRVSSSSACLAWACSSERLSLLLLWMDKNGWCTYPKMVPLVFNHGHVCNILWMVAKSISHHHRSEALSPVNTDHEWFVRTCFDFKTPGCDLPTWNIQTLPAR